MHLFDSFTGLFKARNRVALSKYPSKATADLRNAWKQPLTKYTATIQPHTSPLTMYGGNSYLNGETWEMRREYREWSFREPAVKAALLTKCLAVASLDASFRPDDPNNPQDVEAAAWVEWALSHAAGGIGGLIQSLLLPGLIDGYSMLEPVWDEVEGKEYISPTVGEPGGRKYAGFWTVSRFAQIDTEHIRFKLDEYRQVIGVRPMTGLTGYIELPAEDYLIFSHLKLFENPFGISDLRAIVRDCRAIEEAIKLRRMLLANFSGPFIAAYHKDESVRMQIARVIEKARGTGFVVFPEGTKIDIVNLATSSPDVFNATITFYREQIVMAITGSYLQLLAADAERGSSMVAKSVAELFVWWLALEVCEVVNRQHIPSLVRPNFGNSCGLPRMYLGGINPAEVKAALECFKSAQDIGWVLSKKQVSKVAILDWGDGDDALQPPAQSQQQSGISPTVGEDDNPFAFSDPNPPKPSPAPVTSFKVDWKPYTNPDTGQVGVISPSGQVRYDMKPGADSEPAKPDAAPKDDPKTPINEAEHAKEVDTIAGPSATPEVKAEVSTRLQRAKEAVYGFMYNKFNPALLAVGEALKAVGDEPDDMKKLGYNPTSHSGGGGGINDPLKNATGISTHLAVSIGSKVAAKVFVWLKKKATESKQPVATNADVDFAQAGAWLAELYDKINESVGIDSAKHDPQAVADALKSELSGGQVSPTVGETVKVIEPVKMADNQASGGTPRKTFRVELPAK